MRPVRGTRNPPPHPERTLRQGRGIRLDAAAVLLRLRLEYPARRASLLQLQLRRPRRVPGEDRRLHAGSVVTRDIPNGVFAAGNPCRVIREITEESHLRRISCDQMGAMVREVDRRHDEAPASWRRAAEGRADRLVRDRPGAARPQPPLGLDHRERRPHPWRVPGTGPAAHGRVAAAGGENLRAKRPLSASSSLTSPPWGTMTELR